MHRAHRKRVKGNMQVMPWLLSTSQAIFKAYLSALSPVSTWAVLLKPQRKVVARHWKGREVPVLAGCWVRCAGAPYCSMPSTGKQSWMEHTSQGAAQHEWEPHPCIRLGRGVTSPVPHSWQSCWVNELFLMECTSIHNSAPLQPGSACLSNTSTGPIHLCQCPPAAPTSAAHSSRAEGSAALALAMRAAPSALHLSQPGGAPVGSKEQWCLWHLQPRLPSCPRTPHPAPCLSPSTSARRETSSQTHHSPSLPG